MYRFLTVLSAAAFTWAAPGCGAPPDAELTGELHRADIDDVIREDMNAVRRCYQRRLVEAHSLEGKVVLSMTIGAAGDVSRVEVIDGLDPAVDGCVADLAAAWSFPAPGGAVAVTYPFLFAPG